MSPAPDDEVAPAVEPGALVPSRALPGWVAAAVTFLCSGAVLVMEIVGLRLIAPYVGVTLQTSTAVIGFALAAIATGAWTGGVVADRVDPRRLIAPLMVAGGALVVAVLPLVRFADADAGFRRLLAAGVVVRDMRASPQLGDALRISIGSPAENDALLSALRAGRAVA